MNYATGLTLALTLFGGATAATAQTPPPPPPAEAKTTAAAYVAAAGKSDLYEIESSRIAVRKSRSAAVRSYANMMIRHHQATTSETAKAARKAGMRPPPPMLDPGARASIAELNAAGAQDFDRLYLGQQVPAHEAALDLHQSFGANGDRAELRTTARKAVPIVRTHLATAQRLGASSRPGM